MTASIEEQTDAWNLYAEARLRADKTLAMADGIAAAKAWHAFLNVFLDEAVYPDASHSGNAGPSGQHDRTVPQ